MIDKYCTRVITSEFKNFSQIISSFYILFPKSSQQMREGLREIKNGKTRKMQSAKERIHNKKTEIAMC